MSQERREKKRQKKRKYRIALICSIMLYLVFRSVPSFLATSYRTIVPEQGVLTDKIVTQGIILKNEKVYRADSSGKLEILVKEGERIPAGKQIAHISLLNDTSQLKQELNEIENSITALKKSEKEKELLKVDESKLGENIEDLILNIQENINKGQYAEVQHTKDKLSLYDSKAKDISGEKTLLNQSLDNLNKRKEEIEKDIKSNNINYYSSSGGIVSFSIDGYEEVYYPKEFENYTYDKINILEKDKRNEKPKVDVSVGDPLFKIIDNFEWYMAIKIEDLKDIKSFEKGQSITLSMDEIKKEIKGKILSINITKNKAVMVIKFTTLFHEYYDYRFSTVEIVKYKKEGLKIPTKAIVEKDGIKGVYIKEISGIVKFRPVKVLGEDDNYTYIQKGDNRGFIKLEDGENPIKTITLYDEIFLNTINIKEGQILN